MYTICVALALLGVISGHSDHKDKAGDVEKGLGIVVHPEYSILTGKYSCECARSTKLTRIYQYCVGAERRDAKFRTSLQL